MMKPGMSFLIVAVATCACTSAPPVQVVQAEPRGCQLLGEVGRGHVQCGEGEPSDELLEALKKETRTLGGNTLQCCEVESEAVVVAAYDRNGKMVCTDFFARTGRAYVCPAAPAAK